MGNRREPTTGRIIRASSACHGLLVARRVRIYELENVLNAVDIAGDDGGLIYSLESDYPLTLLIEKRKCESQYCWRYGCD